MSEILWLCCSPRGTQAYSTRMGAELIERLRQQHSQARVVVHDLAAHPPAPIDAAFSAAILQAPEATPEALAESERLIRALEACAVLVITTPMHNYGVPAVLKAWIDQVVRIRRTFVGTPRGKEGLLADRPVYVVVTSGGWFSRPSPSRTPPQPDFLTPYLRAILATIGLRSVQFITLEGLTRGPQAVDAALATGRAAVLRLVDPLPPGVQAIVPGEREPPPAGGRACVPG